MKVSEYKYALGFAFDLLQADCQGRWASPNVALIRKVRPDWQAGFLNGIGGHIEPGETPHECMVREFREEAGVLVPEWTEVLTMGMVNENPGWSVVVFKAFGVNHGHLHSLTDEKVGIYAAYDLPSDVLANLRWIVPLALDPQPIAPKVFFR